jgi:hypothetical protein
MVLIRSAQGVALIGAVIALFANSIPYACAKTQEISKAGQVSVTKLKQKRIRRIASSNAYLVPPPPAYQPAWLPEAYATQGTAMQTTQVKARPENPYSKYIYTAPGHRGVAPVQPNKYVTYWSKT